MIFLPASEERLGLPLYRKSILNPEKGISPILFVIPQLLYSGLYSGGWM
jgi:hypothetical protein